MVFERCDCRILTNLPAPQPEGHTVKPLQNLLKHHHANQPVQGALSHLHHNSDQFWVGVEHQRYSLTIPDSC